MAATGRVSRRVMNQLTAKLVASAAATAMPREISSARARAWSRCCARSGGTAPTARCRWSRNSPGAMTTATTTRVSAPEATMSAWAVTAGSPAGGRAGCGGCVWPLAGSHPVADAAHGADVAGVFGIVVELAAQVADVDVDDVFVAVPLAAPHPF